MAFVSAIILCGFSISDAVETTIDKIVANKNSYDGKEVSVSGTVSGVKFKTSKGKDYTTFTLIGEPGGRLNVFIFGKLKLHGGQKVQVTGKYYKVKKVGKYTFRNQIEATDIQEP
jgi:hypothetical protein